MAFLLLPLQFKLEYHHAITTLLKGITYGPNEDNNNRKTYVKVLFDF